MAGGCLARASKETRASMQMPDSAHRTTETTDTQSRPAGARWAPEAEAHAPAPCHDPSVEANLRRKARRQGALLMGSSALLALALATGAWWVVYRLL